MRNCWNISSMTLSIFCNLKKNKTEGEEKDQEQEGKPVRPMVSCDLCYAMSSYQCKLWIKEDFVKLKMIKKN